MRVHSRAKRMQSYMDDINSGADDDARDEFVPQRGYEKDRGSTMKDERRKNLLMQS